MKKNSVNPFLNHQSYHIFFTNLANPLKIGIILCLRRGEKNVSEISEELKVEQSKVSHALASLKSCKIVDVEQKGKQRIYSLNKDTIVPMLSLIDKHANDYCKCECCVSKGSCGK
ncbi:MAG: metalloregulator ArsR/SmtB family transcription factor [archaeon]